MDNNACMSALGYCIHCQKSLDVYSCEWLCVCVCVCVCACACVRACVQNAIAVPVALGSWSPVRNVLSYFHVNSSPLKWTTAKIKCSNLSVFVVSEYIIDSGIQRSCYEYCYVLAPGMTRGRSEQLCMFHWLSYTLIVAVAILSILLP